MGWVVVSVMLHRVSNCPLSRAMDSCVMHQGTTSSCQFSCHFQDCKALLFTSKHASSIIASTQWPFTPRSSQLLTFITRHGSWQQTAMKLLIIQVSAVWQTTMVPCLPWFLWNAIISLNGKSQIMSLLSTKNGSEFSNKIPRASARGPATNTNTHTMQWLENK